MADLVLWKPAFFGVKPEVVVKGGFIAHAAMGDPNASIPTPQPVLAGPCSAQWGKRSAPRLTPLFPKLPPKSEWAKRSPLQDRRARIELPRDRQEGHAAERRPAEDRGGPRDLRVKADGEALACEPAEALPMAQRYFLF